MRRYLDDACLALLLLVLLAYLLEHPHVRPVQSSAMRRSGVSLSDWVFDAHKGLSSISWSSLSAHSHDPLLLQHDQDCVVECGDDDIQSPPLVRMIMHLLPLPILLPIIRLSLDEPDSRLGRCTQDDEIGHADERSVTNSGVDVSPLRL